MNKNFKKQITHSLLLAIGTIINIIMPGFLGGIKPDFILLILLMIILLDSDYKTALLTGIVAGLLGALTTSFPGGQIPNLIDKIIISHLTFLCLIPLRKYNTVNNIKAIILCLLGTVVSGTVFLSTALILFGLPAPFKILLISVVLPTALVNAILSPILLNILSKSLRISNSKIYDTKIIQS
ncbi:tryptophan transporter [Clostridium grantii]|uniref:Tryptophan transporter TrpP n=1 Tax=Clostridium grantii DSM 8605 TaxID=1121316 RepID=A0A1M5UMI5_9CLOT|nr:tryptophan transporter [Clostridium grantii]SHH64116.1 Tryptophan transporter TrpP [Clostridium grantii DSM 8605]